MRIRATVPAMMVIAALLLAGCETATQTPTPGTGSPTPGQGTPATGTPTPGEGTPGTTPTPGQGTPGPGGSILDQVRANGQVVCGVHTGLPGFGFPEEGTGRFLGFDADFCRAVAAAVFANPDAVQFRPLSADDRSTALIGREIDVLIRNTTWTVTRDADWGLFAPTTFYDGQGMMVRAASGVTQLSDFIGENPTICVQSGTTTEQNLADSMAAAGVEYEASTGDSAFTYTTYDAGDCDGVSSDRSQLLAQRTALSNPDDHVILDVVMSKEPLGPVVPHGDERWFNVVKWVVYATILAEELGIDSTNAAQLRDTSEDPSIRRLLGVQDELGAKLGLDNAWAFNVISSVGNYGEIFERNLGPGTIFNIDRGLNDIWTRGGLLYAPPYR
jgi:general L-amino acid transport system substrate-binding protein